MIVDWPAPQVYGAEALLVQDFHLPPGDVVMGSMKITWRFKDTVKKN